MLNPWAPAKVTDTLRPASICLGPTDPRDLHERHCSSGGHQWPATKSLPCNVQAVQGKSKLRVAACHEYMAPVRCLVGLSAWQQANHGQFVGWKGWCFGETSSGASGSQQPIQLQNRPCMGRAQHRQDSACLQTAPEMGLTKVQCSCPFSPCSGTRQPSPSPHASCMS